MFRSPFQLEWEKILTSRHDACTISPVIIEPLSDFDVEWRERAACLKEEAIKFFGNDEMETPADRRVREEEAKNVCQTCPVRIECLDYAILTNEQYGIWGGMNESELKAEKRARNARRAVRL